MALFWFWYAYDDHLAAFLNIPQLGSVPILVYVGIALFLMVVNNIDAKLKEAAMNLAIKLDKASQ
jgi:hypothetical protein